MDKRRGPRQEKPGPVSTAGRAGIQARFTQEGWSVLTKKLADALFLGLILILLGAGLARTVLSPKEINTYENRYAEQIAPLTVEGWLKGSFQDSVDAALSDQVQLSEVYKRTYYRAATQFLWSAASPILPNVQDRYVNVAGTLLFNGHIVYAPRPLSVAAEGLDGRADNFNQYFAAHPDIDFYVYYIERDIDLDFETGQSVGAREYFLNQLELPDHRIGYLPINSFEEFHDRFLLTDHHWNCVGSYQGYTEALKLLLPEETPLEPLGETVEVGTLYGSRSLGLTSNFSEPFYAYRFDFPEMDPNYGKQAAFLAGEGNERLTYGAFYGHDDGEAILSTSRPERENLLILGESYDNAVVKLLASHFNNTYAVDLRNYKAHTGEDFRFSDYVEERGITKVLLIGCMSYFQTADGTLEG